MNIREEIYSTEIINHKLERIKIFSNEKKLDLDSNEILEDIFKDSDILKNINKNVIKEFKSIGYINYKNNSEVLRFNQLKLNIKDFLKNNLIKEFYQCYSINSYNKIIEKNLIKLYKNSLANNRKVILNSFSYNLGSKGLKQQFNSDYKTEGIDLYLIDPNFGYIKKDKIKQIYHKKSFVQDIDFKIKYIKNSKIVSSKIIRKYYSEKLDMTVYTIPMCIENGFDNNFYRLSKDYEVEKHEDLMAISFSYFLNEGKLLF